jgi:hypothetical protein
MMTKPIEFSGLSSALFSGVEAEGPPRFRGVPTLFVRGDVPLEKILQHRNGNERIYFGAGWLSPINIDTVRALAGFPITVETSSLDVARTCSELGCTVIFTVMMKGLPLCKMDGAIKSLPSQNVYVKFDFDESVTIVPVSAIYFNTYTDYNDVILWEN